MKASTICPVCGKRAKRVKVWYRDDANTQVYVTEYIHALKKHYFGDMVFTTVSKSCEQRAESV